jgi:uncharacterized protein YkwD
VRRLAVLPLLLLLAGCGASAGPSGDARGPSARPSAPGGPLSVGVTDGRLGGAVTDTSGSRERRLAPAGRLNPAPRSAPGAREGLGAGDSCPHATLLPDGGNLPAVTAAVRCLLNGERADRGLTPLRTDSQLQRAALAHGADMVERSYFSHTGRNGSQVADRIRAAGYLADSVSWRVGENLAWGTGDLSTPQTIMKAWMDSPGHRANILRADYREIGLGVVGGNPSGSEGATFVTEFGLVRQLTQVASARAKATPKSRSQARRRRARRARARTALAPRTRVVGRLALAARSSGLGAG